MIPLNHRTLIKTEKESVMEHGTNNFGEVATGVPAPVIAKSSMQISPS
jgi:hypothetical protein